MPFLLEYTFHILIFYCQFLLFLVFLSEAGGTYTFRSKEQFAHFKVCLFACLVKIHRLCSSGFAQDDRQVYLNKLVKWSGYLMRRTTKLKLTVPAPAPASILRRQT